MTIFDKTLQFSNAQAVTTTAVSTNVVDLGAAGTVKGSSASLPRDIAPGTKVPLLVQVVAAFAGATSLAVQAQSSDDEAFGSGVVTKDISGAIPVADLVAGKRMPYHSLPEGLTGRYIRLNYVVVGTATAGAVTAGFVASVDEGK